MRLFASFFLAFLFGTVGAQELRNTTSLPPCPEKNSYTTWNNCHVYLDLGDGIVIDRDIVNSVENRESSKILEKKLFFELYNFKKIASLEFKLFNLSGARLLIDFSELVVLGETRKFNLILYLHEDYPVMLGKNFGISSLQFKSELNCAKREFILVEHSAYFGSLINGFKVYSNPIEINEPLSEQRAKEIMKEEDFSSSQASDILPAIPAIIENVCTSDVRKKIEDAKLKRQEFVEDTRRANTDSRRRFALVIGNSNYSSLSKLPNAINDARTITQSLQSAGFQVHAHENLDLAGMQNAVRVFGEKLSKNDIGLVYYAGHGVQVKGKNYLIPVKENIKKSFEVPSSAVDVDLILATLEHIKNDLNIVVLDACRSSFPGESRGTNRGLATIEAAKGTFIAFATAPGKEALDGSGSNSPYTKHLARLIGKKGLPLEQVFKEVRKAVVAETNGEQVPWENSSLMGDFYFQK